MTEDAPKRPPSYFDWADPNGPGLKPQEAAEWLIDRLWTAADLHPRWTVNGAGEIRITQEVLKRGAAATFEVAGGGVTGTLSLTADGSGWLLVQLHVGQTEVFSGYMDMPYEEYQIWPPGAAPQGDGEPPGRMGKGGNWLQLEAAAWPQLAPLADGRFVTFEAREP